MTKSYWEINLESTVIDHSLNIKNDVMSSIKITERLVEIQKEFLFD